MNRYRTLAPLAIAILVVSVMLSALTACSTAGPSASPQSSPASSSPSSPSASASTKVSSPEEQAYQKAQDDFKKVVEAARNEDEAIIYSIFQVDMLDALAKAFNKVDPKIQVKLMRVAGAAANERLKAEQTTKQYIASAYMGGAPVTRWMDDEKITQPLDVPVLHEPGVKWVISPTFDKPKNTVTITFNKFLLLYNTQLIPAGQEPKTWRDLADPRFKDKLVFWDPRISSTPRALFGALYLDSRYGPDVVRKITENTRVSPDSADAVRVVAKGEAAVTLSTVASYKEVAGAPVKLVNPSDGAMLSPTQIAMVLSAPHPNTVRVFANWILSKEGQQVLGTGYGVVRGDVDAEEKLGQALPGEQLFPNVPWSAEYESKINGEPIDMVKKWMAELGR